MTSSLLECTRKRPRNQVFRTRNRRAAESCRLARKRAADRQPTSLASPPGRRRSLPQPLALAVRRHQRLLIAATPSLPLVLPARGADVLAALVEMFVVESL